MSTEIVAPLQGTLVSVVADGAVVAAGAAVAVIESMKMEHVVSASCSGRVEQVRVTTGDQIGQGDILVVLDEHEAPVPAVVSDAAEPAQLRSTRTDLTEVIERHEVGLDVSRPDAVDRRRRKGRRTTRENLADLLDAGSFIEYGPTVVAAQRRRRSMDDLIERTPADGMAGGLGTVDGQQVVVVAYDETVLAGTQGLQNHRKKDRLFEIAAEQRLPVVLFAEGGGGRPGDTDGVGGSGLDTQAFRLWGELSGLVPLVGINAGYCFAGNAALLGCCDIVIATEDSNLGMGGPAMIEGGGLGVVEPTEVGPIEVQRANGVVDVVVTDEAEAVAIAKQYLSTFTPRRTEWAAPDQMLLREAIPENRLRVYDVRAVIDTLCDTDSVLEVRRDFGLGMVTALARIEGRAVGIIANNPTHLAGAIDSDGADKAARFLELCDAFDVPVVFLCDTPGIMVGPEVEKTALVRHAARLFVTAGGIEIPFVTVVLRKGYGLGAMTMAGGSFKTPIFTVSWPTGEFGGMGLEGAVRLGYRKELEAIDDPDEREAAFEEMVERMYQYGKALNTATTFEIDDVIDPADTRRWITRAFDAAPAPEPRSGKKRPGISPW